MLYHLVRLYDVTSTCWGLEACDGGEQDAEVRYRGDLGSMLRYRDAHVHAGFLVAEWGRSLISSKFATEVPPEKYGDTFLKLVTSPSL
jgi:hypothetical protein